MEEEEREEKGRGREVSCQLSVNAPWSFSLTAAPAEGVSVRAEEGEEVWCEDLTAWGEGRMKSDIRRRRWSRQRLVRRLGLHGSSCFLGES